MIKIAISRFTDPSINLTLEKEFFDGFDGTPVIFLWQNDNTIVIGANQCSFLECNIPLCQNDGVKIVRRTTGGGAVYHDMGNINFSFIFDILQDSAASLLELITASLNSLGISNIDCERNDLLINGEKFSGHAYYKEGTTMLFHGTLLVSSDLNKLERYLTPSVIKLQAKGIDSIRKRVGNLSDVKPLTVSQVLAAIISTVRKMHPPIKIITLEKPNNKALLERFANLSWLSDDNPECSFRIDVKVPRGLCNIIVSTSGSVVTKVKVYSDELLSTNFASYEQEFLGKPFSQKSMKERFAAEFSG